jgi:catechol 2,3-dioxygenase-like lactoylglutathione lyase family enzyme
LTATGSPEVNLAIVDAHHESVPEGFRRPVEGVLLNFEVDDVDAEYARLQGAGIPIALELRSEDWGQRHFIVRDPDDALIDIITPIAPSAEFAANYS